jgi:anti-sigma factor RsiW
VADCRDLESLFAPYVDGEAGQIDCAAVDAHLKGCPACRERVSREREVREAIVARRANLRGCASADLRRRCEARRPVAPAVVRTGGFGRPSFLSRPSWVPLSMVATILLAVGGVFFYGLRGGSGALAAQLVADHVKCFEFAPQPSVIPDARALSREWSTQRGWTLKVPESTMAEQLELLGMRRCISTDGITAHVMYKWKGQPLSVYVLNSERSGIGPVPHVVERFGQEAIMWSKRGRTYAVVARGRPADVEHVAKYVQTAAE